MHFEHHCKVCKSGKAEDIEFCRYFLDWKYKIIIDVFCEDIDDLSGYNLSTHFNRHTSHEAKAFWRELKANVKPDNIHD